MLMGKTDPNFPGKLLHTWPLFSDRILLLGILSGPLPPVDCGCLIHAEMLMTKEKVTFSTLRNQG